MAADWRTRTLREIHQGGIVSIDPRQSSEETFEYYSIPAYQSGCTPVRAKGESILSQKLMIPQRCVLFGKLNPRVEKVWNVKSESNSRRLASTEWLPIVPPEDVDQDFLYFLLRSEHVMPIAQSLVSGSTPSRERVEPRAFYDIQVPVPGIDEQTAIAAVLSKVQRAIEIEEKLVATTRELKQAAMRQLFTFGTRGDDTRDTPYGQVPASWDIQPLSACATVQTGVTKGRAIPADEAIEVPYLRVANVQDGYLDLTEIKSITIRRGELDSYRLQEGDVVLTEGGDFDKLGRGFIWHGQIEPCIHQNHVFAVRTNRDVLVPEFLAYLAQSPYGRSYFLTVAHKTTNLACINSTKLKAFPVPLPVLKDQQELVEVLGGIDRKAQVHESRRRILLDIFDQLLMQLMSGHLFVDGLQPS
jgi:type I restriction enzyme S subunit